MELAGRDRRGAATAERRALCRDVRPRCNAPHGQWRRAAHGTTGRTDHSSHSIRELLEKPSETQETWHTTSEFSSLSRRSSCGSAVYSARARTDAGRRREARRIGHGPNGKRRPHGRSMIAVECPADMMGGGCADMMQSMNGGGRPNSQWGPIRPATRRRTEPRADADPRRYGGATLAARAGDARRGGACGGERLGQQCARSGAADHDGRGDQDRVRGWTSGLQLR